jgi:hypothetical protein
MYILGLSSSCGTSRIRPAWSLFEHQLTPALSPIRGLRPKPRRPEEVVYSPNDSCSHFTQHLFPPKLPQQHTCTIFSIHSPHSYLLYITFKQAFTSFYYKTKSFFFPSALHGRLTTLGLSCPIQLVVLRVFLHLKKQKMYCMYTLIRSRNVYLHQNYLDILKLSKQKKF